MYIYIRVCVYIYYIKQWYALRWFDLHRIFSRCVTREWVDRAILKARAKYYRSASVRQTSLSLPMQTENTRSGHVINATTRRNARVSNPASSGSFTVLITTRGIKHLCKPAPVPSLYALSGTAAIWHLLFFQRNSSNSCASSSYEGSAYT